MALECDSSQYQVLQNAASAIKNVSGMTCEIGVREGGGSKYIIDGLMEAKDFGRTHVCIDPYGNIEYTAKEGSIVKLDYTNAMRNRCIKDLYEYTLDKNVNLLFFVLEDTEFFDRYSEGVPSYNENKKTEYKYALVHFDGPHDVASIMREIRFFEERTDPGAMFIFDDVVGYYDHDVIDEYLLQTGWELKERSPPKASYIKRFCKLQDDSS